MEIPNQKSITRKCLWSIKTPQIESPIQSSTIEYLKFFDGIISGFFKYLIPGNQETSDFIAYFGGDVYDLTEVGLFEYVLSLYRKSNGKNYDTIRLVNLSVVVVYDMELTREILNSKSIIRGVMYSRLTKFFGFGIFTSAIHERWSHQRNLMMQLFNHSNIKTMEAGLSVTIFTELDRIIQSQTPTQLESILGSYSDSTLEPQYDSIDLVSVLSRITLVGFCETVLGIHRDDIPAIDTIADVLINPMNRLLVYINGAAEPFDNPYEQRYIDFCEDRDQVHQWMRDVIELIQSENNVECHSIIKDEINRVDIGMDQKVEFVLSVILGGHETTSRMLLGIIYCMCHDEAIIENLNRETSQNQDKPITSQSPSRSFVYKIISEGARLFPPVWILGRQAKNDIKIDSPIQQIYFPKGTQFLISPLIYLRDPIIWGTDSEIFNPYRYNKLTEQQKRANIPFAIGAENCSGKKFAVMEAAIVIAKLFYEYKIEILEHELRPFSAGTFRLTDKLPVRITKI